MTDQGKGKPYILTEQQPTKRKNKTMGVGVLIGLLVIVIASVMHSDKIFLLLGVEDKVLSCINIATTAMLNSILSSPLLDMVGAISVFVITLFFMLQPKKDQIFKLILYLVVAHIVTLTVILFQFYISCN